MGIRNSIGRGARGLAAAMVMAVSSGMASATLLSDVTLDALPFYVDLVDTAVVDLGTSNLVDAFNIDGDAFFRADADDGGGVTFAFDDDLLLLDPLSFDPQLEGRAEDWAIDTAADTLEILYAVTFSDGSLTSSALVVAVLDYGFFGVDLTDPLDLSALDAQVADVAVFDAALVPLPATVLLLLSGVGLLSVHARRRRG